MRRPVDAVVPRPGQESVWDYPRPPSVEPVAERIVVRFGGEVVADTRRACRVLETSHPPVYYLPPADIRMDLIHPAPGSSFCEFKGMASYVTIIAGGLTSQRAGWVYMQPVEPYRAIAGFLAFYASRVDEAYVGQEMAVAQPGDFYGGWITSRIVGPFKGAPGTFGW